MPVTAKIITPPPTSSLVEVHLSIEDARLLRDMMKANIRIPTALSGDSGIGMPWDREKIDRLGRLMLDTQQALDAALKEVK